MHDLVHRLAGMGGEDLVELLLESEDPVAFLLASWRLTIARANTLALGADRTLRDAKGRTALDYARKRRPNGEAARILGAP